MKTSQKQQPHEQADGYGGDTPRRDNARSYLNTALQLIELGRPRMQMALGRQAALDLEESIMKAIALLEPIRPAAPDPAFAEMLSDIEQTNRELGLTGDALAIEAELDR